jgi:hypothetical protein
VVSAFAPFGWLIDGRLTGADSPLPLRRGIGRLRRPLRDAEAKLRLRRIEDAIRVRFIALENL